MPTLDAFKGDSFSTASLTASINALPHRPGRIGDMKVFAPKGIATNVAWLEEKAGTLTLIANRLRGGPANQHNQGKRTARAIAIPHLPLEDEILAADLQDIRAFGSESNLEGITEVVAQHLEAMRWNHEATIEHMRVGALHGKVLDSDASTVLVNLFDMFSVTEQTKDFVFTTTTTDIRGAVVAVKRLVEDEMGGMPFGGVHVICGNAWWDAFISHADVKSAFDRWQFGAQRQQDFRFTGFTFADVTFENYRGKVGGTDFVNTDVARAFPVGTRGLFQELYGPADFVETVNTIGLPMYAKQKLLDFDRGVRLHTQSNPLPICMKPKTLVELTKS